MQTTKASAPSKSIATTEALSVSRVLPDGCTAFRQGLVIPKALPLDQWERLGRQLAELAGSTQWLLGDWFAYGQETYHGVGEYQRIEHGIYAKMAALTGLSEQRLRNAKWVCSAINLSRRRDKLTPAHAEEIVGRSTPGQYDYWIDQVQKGDLTVKHLREQLRRSKSLHKPEPNDVGKVTPLAITDQYVRDILPHLATMTPEQRREHLTNLKPVLEKLSDV